MKQALWILLISISLLFLSCSDDSSSPSDDLDDTFELTGTVVLDEGVEITEKAHVYCVWKKPMSGMYIHGKSPIDWDNRNFTINLETPLPDDCYFEDGLAFCYIFVFEHQGYFGDINENTAISNAIGNGGNRGVVLLDNLDNDIIARDFPNAERGFIMAEITEDEQGKFHFTENSTSLNITIKK